MVNTPKKIVITGAAKGIGHALAQRFATEGFHVIGIDREPHKAETTLLSDFSSDNDLSILIEQLKTLAPIDVLIHNAGISHVSRFEDSDLEQQQLVLQVNLFAPMRITNVLIESNTFSESASLIFISSLSHFTGYPGAAVYAMSKDGLAAYAEGLRRSESMIGKHLMTVFPGPTRTGHARRYSPDNTRESSRMLPETLAEYIFRAYQKRKRNLIPGIRNQLAAWLGRWFPSLTERMLCKAILNKLK